MHIKSLKNQPAVNKGMLKAVLPLLKSLHQHGKRQSRKRSFGARGTKMVSDLWSWPAKPDDFLFPAERPDSKLPHRCKNSACKAVQRARACFQPAKALFVETEKIRTHSGRHRMINDMKDAQVAQETAMKFARITDVRTFMGYGALTDEQAACGLNDNTKLMLSLGTTYSMKKAAKATSGAMKKVSKKAQRTQKRH